MKRLKLLPRRTVLDAWKKYYSWCLLVHPLMLGRRWRLRVNLGFCQKPPAEGRRWRLCGEGINQPLHRRRLGLWDYFFGIDERHLIAKELMAQENS